MPEQLDHECDFPETCPVCLGPAPTPGVEPVRVVARFRARLSGDCGECGLSIYEGQLIARLSNDRYVHDGCADDLVGQGVLR